ncbi:unnamed protein product [Calypogeia fissa]
MLPGISLMLCSDQDVGVVNALAQIEGIGDCGELQITL